MKKVPLLLTLCPKCGKKMRYNTIQSGQSTSCICGYQEAPGSVYVLNFISEVIGQYAVTRGIKTVRGLYGDNYSVTRGQVFGASAYLPLFFSRAQKMAFGKSHLCDILAGFEVFGLTKCLHSVVGTRVAVNGVPNSVSEIKMKISQQLIALTFVLDETIGINKKVSVDNRGTISLEYMPGIPIEDLKRTRSRLTARQMSPDHEGKAGLRL